jgi:hypothetical protein
LPNKSAISFVLWWNSLNKIEQNSETWNFENFSGFLSTETSLETSYEFDIPKFRSQKIPESTPEVSVGQKKNIYKTNNFGLKTRNFSFQKPEVSVRKPEVSVEVVFRNASVPETRNFELLCCKKWSKDQFFSFSDWTEPKFI